MSFQEKSAYVMVVALLSSGGLYFYQVLFQSMQIDEWISPVVPGLVQLTVIMVIVAIIGHIVIASLSSLSYKESQAKLDERERQIFNIAGRLSGFILGSCPTAGCSRTLSACLSQNMFNL